MTYSFAKGTFRERGICAVAGLGIEPWVLYEVDKYSTPVLGPINNTVH